MPIFSHLYSRFDSLCIVLHFHLSSQLHKFLVRCILACGLIEIIGLVDLIEVIGFWWIWAAVMISTAI
jgi:hypothetical protein